MGAINHPSRQPAPPAAISRILSRFSREELEGFVAIAIDLMDVADGNPDLEDGGDNELDGDAQGDQAWPEWHTRGWRTQRKAGPEMASSCRIGGQEDDEDDDPAEQDDAAEDDDPAGGNVEDEGEREDDD
ncbi:hypothetical protein [Sphingobium yanoikuyae]|uniref:Uncharacterized protein n=1 Tax=Sphingobium yanoikuyae TaxID=13690 RepID=A0A9X7YBY4_SPHYA|nr:hypothetical protein [Sphingobium yanoikuyae]QNG45010.1 hypothetical protein H3V42_24795 [Sphingobium yanoikuyae]